MERQNNKTIFDQLSVFFYRKWLFLAPVGLGALIGFSVSMNMPEKYSSTTLILAEEQQVPEQYVAPADRTPFSQRLNVISQQILSRTKLEKIIKEHNLYADSRGGLLTKLSVLNIRNAEEPTDDWIIEQMRSEIEFLVTGDTSAQRKGSREGGNTFTITYKGGADPETTMKVTDTIASLFIEENLKAREQFAEGTSEFLGAELETAKAELEEQEKSLKTFRERHMGTLPEQLEANLRTLDRLQMELQSVNAALRSTEDKKAILEEQLNVVVPGKKTVITSSPVVNELQRLRNELSLLRSMYKETYPDVIIAKKRIADIEEQLRAGSDTRDKDSGDSLASSPNPEVYAEVSGIKSEIATLKQRETQIRRQITDYERRVELTPANEQMLADLTRDHSISQQNYQSLLEKKMNARLAENLEKNQKGARFRIIDTANLPQAPDSPNKLSITLYGMSAGSAVGTGLVLLFEFLNPAFRKPEDFEGVVPSPVLTTIPVFQVVKNNDPKLKVIKGRKDIA